MELRKESWNYAAAASSASASRRCCHLIYQRLRHDNRKQQIIDLSGEQTRKPSSKTSDFLWSDPR